jgi:lysophospholipase L1-like esterase
MNLGLSLSLGASRAAGGGGGAPVTPSTVDYTYAQVEGHLTGTLRINNPTGKTTLRASSAAELSGIMAIAITGTDAELTAFQNASATPANMIEVSIDGGAWAAAPVVGGRYVLFSGLPQALRLVLIRIGTAFGTTANIPNTGNVLRVTGAPPAISNWTFLAQPGDGNTNTFTPNALSANGTASAIPALVPTRNIAVASNCPAQAVRGNFSEMVVAVQSRYVYVSEAGAAPTRYDLGTAAGTGSGTRFARITGLSGLRTYYVWTDSDWNAGRMLAVGGVTTGGLVASGVAGALDQYGDSITEGTSSTSRGEMEGFRVAAALNRICGNFGESGDTIQSLNTRLDTILAAKTVTGADVAIIAIGRNNGANASLDATETTAYESIITKLLTKGYGRIICRGIFQETAGDFSLANASIAAIVAGRSDPKVVFCNTTAWTGIDRPDNVHPSDAGYDTLAAYALADYPPLIGTLP